MYNSHTYAVFTVCNIAYMPKALALAESLLKYDRKKLIIYIVDKKIDLDVAYDNAEFIWIEDAGVPDLYGQAFKYDITEFSTSLKPYLASLLLNFNDKVIFLDPDTCIYHSLDPILDDLDKYPIMVTPHYMTPHSDLVPDSDIAMMRFGSFNLGFFGVSKSEQATYFLDWWNDRCRRYCYFETQFGLSTDQKWVSIAPCFFPDLHVSFNVGYNTAFWNLHERVISKDGNGNYIINGNVPLIFFHFSSYDEKNPDLLSQRYFFDKNNKRKDYFELSINYDESLKKYNNGLSAVKYGFDYMSNGDYISPTLRRAYACVQGEIPSDHNPFDSKGPVGRFAKRNYLLEKNSEPFHPSGYSDINDNKIKFIMINASMRIILRLIGPNKFANISRLLVYLSSYRQNRNLWKL